MKKIQFFFFGSFKRIIMYFVWSRIRRTFFSSPFRPQTIRAIWMYVLYCGNAILDVFKCGKKILGLVQFALISRVVHCIIRYLYEWCVFRKKEGMLSRMKALKETETISLFGSGWNWSLISKPWNDGKKNWKMRRWIRQTESSSAKKRKT